MLLKKRCSACVRGKQVLKNEDERETDERALEHVVPHVSFLE